jgi:pyrroline-5-carboxylate reductase
MATALAGGLIKSRVVSSASIVATDVSPDARRHFEEQTGAATAAANAAAVESATTVILAVKPQVVRDVLQELKTVLGPRHLLVSIAAGTTIAQLMEWSGGQCRVVRVMPNTPALVRSGAAGYAVGPTATESDRTQVQRLLETVGTAVLVPERLLDAVTGLSGSGPAYVFQFIEALSDGGVRMGLPREASLQLAAQTVFGAAQMVLETGDHPARLKDAVTSPGGTTIAGLHALESGGFRGVVMDAVQAATLRSQELGRG